MKKRDWIAVVVIPLLIVFSIYRGDNPFQKKETNQRATLDECRLAVAKARGYGADAYSWTDDMPDTCIGDYPLLFSPYDSMQTLPSLTKPKPPVKIK